MGAPSVFQTNGYSRTNTTIRAYVLDDQTGANMQQSVVSGIAYTVTSSLGNQQGNVTGSGSLSPVSTYLSNTLSTTGWTQDTRGYNFQATLPASCFPEAGQFAILLTFTLAADGTTFVVKLDHHAWSRN